MWRRGKMLVGLIVMLSIIWSCQSDSAGLFWMGKWRATNVLEDNKPMTLDPSNIKIHLLANGQYQYHSTLNYREAGNYVLERNLLKAQDTVHEGSVERVVELSKVANDTMKMRMMSSGKERIITFVRDSTISFE